jgi:peptide/nickel transport system permease protein
MSPLSPSAPAPSVAARMNAKLRGRRVHGSTLIGAAILTAILLLALLGPLVAPSGPNTLGQDALTAPSAAHWMGTDDLGRDVFSRFVEGARVSLSIGLMAAGASCLIGVAIGATAGFSGGLIDRFLMRVAEAFQVIPRFFLALVVVALFGSHFILIVIVIGILSWPEVARIARAEFLSLRERDFVVAAQTIGERTSTILLREILPNAAGPLIVVATLQISMAILLEASLSFLGLGDIAHPSWGLMLNNAQAFMGTAWWLSVFPGLGILLTVGSLNLLGDGLNHLLDPRARAR